MKIGALDIGDQWVGTALSDALGIIARPYQTVTASELDEFIKTWTAKERISIIIIGHPKTMGGTTSQQTKKVEETALHLETIFPSITWILWDERLSSKRADAQRKGSSKEDKHHSHSIAAAFILDSYLTYRHIQNDSEIEE